ncbi:hypothetical protein [Herbaspirillum sp. ST 5-3]|nr:hypothetical protein [Herbaspirillum sp. ST 5-3]
MSFLSSFLSSFVVLSGVLDEVEDLLEVAEAGGLGDEVPVG